MNRISGLLEETMKEGVRDLAQILLSDEEMTLITETIDEITQRMVKEFQRIIPVLMLVLDSKTVSSMPPEKRESLGLPKELPTEDGVAKRIVLTIPVYPGDNWHQDIFAQGMEAGKVLPVVACFLVSETWYSEVSISKDKAVRTSTYTRPMNDPNRKEAVMISGKSIDSRVRLCMRDIVRPGGVQGEGELVLSEKMTEPSGQIETMVLDAFWRGFALGYVHKYLLKRAEENPEIKSHLNRYMGAN